MITNNLVTLMVFPGTYQDRFEGENIDWIGGIDVAKAMDPILINNTVAGSERVGFNIKGERCSDPNAWSNNVAHSSYHGVLILKTGQDPCTRVHDFVSYRNFDYGLYALTSSSLEISESTFVDNGANILVHDFGPSALSHVVANKHVLVEDSLIVGNSDSFDCDLDKVNHHYTYTMEKKPIINIFSEPLSTYVLFVKSSMSNYFNKIFANLFL